MTFDPSAREQLRRKLLGAAAADPRLSGGAITGSATTGALDRWSDIDLAFGVHGDLEPVLADWTTRMYGLGAVHHVDVRPGAWIYRVFVMGDALQVDLAFAPEAEFGAKAPTFQLVFGDAVETPHAPKPDAEWLVGMAWLHALHARSAIERGRLWQAEYMISAVRDHVVDLVALRHGVPTSFQKGAHLLPAGALTSLEAALVSKFDLPELRRAFGAVIAALTAEVKLHDEALALRLSPVFNDLACPTSST